MDIKLLSILTIDERTKDLGHIVRLVHEPWRLESILGGETLYISPCYQNKSQKLGHTNLEGVSWKRQPSPRQVNTTVIPRLMLKWDAL
jgi:hypothetical protein